MRFSRERRHVSSHILVAVGVVAATVLSGLAIESSSAATFGARASVDPQIQYLGDSTGTTFTFTVENTGTTDPIGAVQIGRPGKSWTIIGCPLAPAGWSAQRSDTMCRYRSATGTADDIAPGAQSSQFQVTATVAPGTQNVNGTWSVKVSRSSNFDTPSKLVAAASAPPGLGTTAYSFEVLDAVVTSSAATPGAACPAPSKSAITGSTGHTIVICGRNRTTGTLTPNAANSSLGGTFVASHGSFSSGPVAPTATGRVLGNWDGVTITSVAGPNKTVVAKIGSASNRTSPETTLTGYEALNNPPTADDDVVYTDQNNTVSFDPRINDEDPDLDPITISSVSTTGTSGTVSITGGGTGLTYDPFGAFDYLAVGESGTTTFTYTISDPYGAMDTATVTVHVSGLNDDPTAADDAQNVSEDSTGASVDVLGNDSDPDTSDTLTVSAVDTTGTTGSVTNNGTDLTYDPNGQFEYLAADETATDSFTYTASDSKGGTDTATVTITINGDNDPPVAVDDSGTGFETGAESAFTTHDVLANDTDADGDTLSVDSLDTTGTQGTVSDNGDGTFEYDPDGAFDELLGGATDTDTFDYTVSDGTDTATATVTITITGVNDAPTANDDAQSVGENSTGDIISVRANDTDPDTSDTLTIDSVNTTGTAGTVTNNGTDITYDPNGLFDYLAAGETATDSFTYGVTDSHGGTDTAKVTITVTGANDPPVAVDDSTTVGKADPGTAINVLGNDSDPESDPLVVSAVDTTGTQGSVSITNGGAEVTYDPAGAFDDLAPGDQATDTFVYTVSDGNGGTDTAAVTVTINSGNAVPTADATSANGNEDGGAITVNLSGDDADGDALTFTAGTATGGLVSVPTAATCSGGVPNHCTATSTYTPNSNFNGTDSFTYTVNDGTVDSLPATAGINITAVNDAPSFTKGVNQSVAEDAGPQTVSNWASAMSKGPGDESAQTLTFVVTTSNDALFSTLPAVSPTGTLTYTPATNASGVATVTLKITDDGGTANGGVDESPTQQFTITVTAVNDAPTAVDDSGSTDEDTPLSVVAPGVLANDTDVDAGDTKTVVQLNGSGTLTGTSTKGAAVTINTNGSYTYNPGSVFQGLSTGESDTDTFTYKMQDSGGAQSTATVTLTIYGINDAPTANADSYTGAVGNTKAVLGTTGTGPHVVLTGNVVLTNDTDAEGDSLAAVAETVASTGGGSATINADGSFTFLPGVGDKNQNDTFTYHVTDGSATSAGTVTVGISNNLVWYADNALVSNGTGTSTSPFNTLANLQGADPDGAGDFIFLYTGSGQYAGGLVLEANQSLIGQPQNLVVGGATLRTGDGTNPTITNAAGAGITLANDVVIRRVNVADTSLQGISGGAITNADIGPNLSVTNTTGVGFSLNGAATGTVTMAGTITHSSVSSRAVFVQNRTGGTVTFSGAISETGGGIFANTNAGTTISFTGGITANTGVNEGFKATGGGTVSVTGTNTLATTTSPALTVTGTSIGAGGLTFQSINTNGAAPNGIVLSGTGAAGGLTVTGTGSAGSGGTIQGTSGDAISLTNVGAPVSLTNMATSTDAGVDVLVNGGGANVTYSGTITNTQGRSVVVQNKTGGTVTFGGAVSDTGTGILLSSNPGALVRFDGGLTMSTGANPAFTATGGGSVAVTGTNTIATTTGTALNVANTTIHADGLTFRSISSNGAATGIVLNTTGNSGRLVVAGNGGTCVAGNTAGCSGGEIRNSSGVDEGGALPTGTGIVLNSTLNPSFTRMYLHDHSNYAVRGTSVAGFTLVDSVISGVNGTSALTAHKDGSVWFEELTGTVTMTNVPISGGYYTNLMVDNTSGVLNGTFDNVDSGTIDATGGDDAIQFEGIGTSTMNVEFKNSAVTTASGDLFQYIGDGTGGGNLDLTGNAFTNNEPSIATGGGGIALVAGAKGAATMDVLNNTMKDSLTNALTIIKSRDNTAGTNNLVANVTNNTIGLAGTANSGSAEGDGMEITTFGDGNATFNVTNNNVRQYNSSAFQFVAGSGVADAGQFNINFSGNSAGNPGTNPSITLLQGVRVDSGVDINDTFATCVKFGANTITGSSDAANKDFRLVASQNTTIRQPGYGGGATDGAAFAAFAAGLIGSGAQGTAVANAPATFLGTGATCP